MDREPSSLPGRFSHPPIPGPHSPLLTEVFHSDYLIAPCHSLKPLATPIVQSPSSSAARGPTQADSCLPLPARLSF